MDDGIYELVQKILYGVAFIGIGGTIALVFFFIFAPSIIGSRSTNKQLEALRRQTEEMNEKLARIARSVGTEKGTSKTSVESDKNRTSRRD
jgi:hypothetical protein